MLVQQTTSFFGITDFQINGLISIRDRNNIIGRYYYFITIYYYSITVLISIRDIITQELKLGQGYT